MVPIYCFTSASNGFIGTVAPRRSSPLPPPPTHTHPTRTRKLTSTKPRTCAPAPVVLFTPPVRVNGGAPPVLAVPQFLETTGRWDDGDSRGTVASTDAAPDSAASVGAHPSKRPRLSAAASSFSSFSSLPAPARKLLEGLCDSGRHAGDGASRWAPVLAVLVRDHGAGASRRCCQCSCVTTAQVR